MNTTHLLLGDMSGIQEYIFKVKSKGAAKELQNRSNHIGFLTKKCFDIIMKLYPKSEKIYCGGGNFLILSSNSFDVTELQKKINLEMSNIDLNLFLTTSTASNFSDAYSMVMQNKHWTKYQQKDIDWNTFNSDSNISKDDSGDSSTSIPIWTTDLIKEIKNTLNVNQLIENDQDPKEEDKIDFNFLAEFANIRTGTKKLGILKMDVDNLSIFFKDCSLEKLEKRSKIFESFFVTNILGLRKKLFPNDIYTVFVGGDDCFFIGGWDKILEFAMEVNDNFKDFANELQKNELTKTETNISISAGIVIVDSTYPIVQFSDLAEDALSIVKTNGKNGVSIFEEKLSWDAFEKTKEITDILCKVVKYEDSRAILDILIKSGSSFKIAKNRANDKIIDFPRVWGLKYYLRNIKNKEAFKLLEENVINEYTNALKNLFQHKETINPMMYPIAARWCEFLTRK